MTKTNWKDNKTWRKRRRMPTRKDKNSYKATGLCRNERQLKNVDTHLFLVYINHMI